LDEIYSNAACQIELSVFSIIFDRNLEQFLGAVNIQPGLDILAMAIHGDMLDIQVPGDLFSRLVLREMTQYILLALSEFFYRASSGDSG
jgi:hypothetical protein